MKYHLLSALILIIACSPDNHQSATSDSTMSDIDQDARGELSGETMMEAMMEESAGSTSSAPDQDTDLDLNAGSDAGSDAGSGAGSSVSEPRPDPDDSTADDPTPNELSPEPSDEAAYIYDQSVVHQFDLILTPENLEILDSDPTAEEYVPGRLVFEGVTYDVGVRYKGSAGALSLIHI